METAELVRMAVDELGKSVGHEIRGLTAEQLAYRPSPRANTIAFLAWHICRTLDRNVHETVPAVPGPDIWAREGWQARFGVSAEAATGQGFDDAAVGAFRPDKALLLDYAARVGPAAAEAVGRLSAADFDRLLERDGRQMSVGLFVQRFIMGHLYWHLGEIRFLKGMQGMPFPR